MPAIGEKSEDRIAALDDPDAHVQAPDSQVRPLPGAAGAPEPPRQSTTREVRARDVRLVIAVGPGVLAPGETAYVTVTRAEGAVIVEGATDPYGRFSATLRVPAGVSLLHVHVETASRYRSALVAIADDGPTVHAFG